MSAPAREAIARPIGFGEEAQLAAQFMKLNHLGEWIAVNIYGAQVRVCRLRDRSLLPMLEECLEHERRHLRLFAAVLEERGVAQCRGFALLGSAGYLLGLVTALFGRPGVMACTAAVETVVLEHLDRQLAHLRRAGDSSALAAIDAILDEERGHRSAGIAGGRDSFLYNALYAAVAPATALVIALGMHL